MLPTGEVLAHYRIISRLTSLGRLDKQQICCYRLDRSDKTVASIEVGMTTRILAGGVPEPDELFGREHTISYIWEQLQGNNVLLVAPRRFA